MIALGPEYGETINNEAKCLTEKGGPVTFSALMKAAKEKWRVSGKGAPMKQVAPLETALSNVNLGERHANLDCYHYGEKGHTKANCPKWIAEQQQRHGSWKDVKCGFPGILRHLPLPLTRILIVHVHSPTRRPLLKSQTVTTLGLANDRLGG